MAQDQKPRSSSSPQSPPVNPSSPDKAAVESSIEAREQEQENIDAQQAETGTLTPQASVREQELELELQVLRKQLADQAQPTAPKLPAFKLPKGEEKYTHARITKLNGVTLEAPMVQAFHADQYEQISKTPGFEATVLHKGKEE